MSAKLLQSAYSAGVIHPAARGSEMPFGSMKLHRALAERNLAVDGLIVRLEPVCSELGRGFQLLGARRRAQGCGLGRRLRHVSFWKVSCSPFYRLLLYIYFSVGASWRPISPQFPLVMEDTQKTITLTNAQLERVTAGDIDPILLLAGHAMILDEKERSTIETLKTHWKAAVYSLILSTALIMEGYDAVIVSPRSHGHKADGLDGLFLRSACFSATLWG
jgi:hypothetical protein